MKRLVKVSMVAVWHTFFKWRETAIASISYYMCLYLYTFNYVFRRQINVATLMFPMDMEWFILMGHIRQVVNLNLKDMSLKGRLSFWFTLAKMCSRLTHYIAFVANIIVNTFTILKSTQLRGIECIRWV